MLPFARRRPKRGHVFIKAACISESDLLAVQCPWAAGYDPRARESFLRRLLAQRQVLKGTPPEGNAPLAGAGAARKEGRKNPRTNAAFRGWHDGCFRTCEPRPSENLTMKGPIPVTPSVLAGLEFAIENYRDRIGSPRAIARELDRMGFPSAAQWICYNSEAFLSGVANGFVPYCPPPNTPAAAEDSAGRKT